MWWFLSIIISIYLIIRVQDKDKSKIRLKYLKEKIQ